MQTCAATATARRCERVRSAPAWRAAWPPESWSTPGAPSCLLWFLRRRRARETLCTSACCRRNGLANAPFPLPILCPADGVEPVDGVLPDLGFVEGCCDARQSCLNLLPYVGPGWYPKVSLAAMLDLGVCR